MQRHQTTFLHELSNDIQITTKTQFTMLELIKALYRGVPVKASSKGGGVDFENLDCSSGTCAYYHLKGNA